MTETPGASPLDPQELADEREREVEEMERRSQELESRLGDAREDWTRKRADPGVPGAPAPDDEPGKGSDTDAD